MLSITTILKLSYLCLYEYTLAVVLLHTYIYSKLSTLAFKCLWNAYSICCGFSLYVDLLQDNVLAIGQPTPAH